MLIDQKATKQAAIDWLQRNFKTAHGRMMLLGWFVIACYVPYWTVRLGISVVHGFGSVFTAAALVLGLFRFWQQRQKLATLEASEADRWLGYFLIITGLLLFPLGFSTTWIQKIVCLQVFAGLALSYWGMSVFGRFPIPVFLVGIGLFPEMMPVAKTLWQTFTPPDMLERLMAWSGTLGLRAIGQDATLINGTFIQLPGGMVEVQWGCNGFDMAAVMAIATLVVGLALKESLPKVVVMIAVGILLALIVNIPRIMLLAMSDAYWGKAAFDFWHGPWGGQIFAGAMFTIYYYLIMAIRNRKRTKRSAS